MIGGDAQPRGASLTLEKVTSLDAAHRKVESAPPGKTMFQTLNNSLEEFTSFLHNYKNLNRTRARDSRRDLNSLDINKISRASFNVQQVGEIEKFSQLMNNKRLSQSDLAENLKSFLKNFPGDNTEKNLALLSIKQKVVSQADQLENAAQITSEIDRILQPAERSLAFQAGVLEKTILGWSGEQGIDIDSPTEFQSPTYPIALGNMQEALSGLREKFGDTNIAWGTNEVYRQLSAQYHASGRNIDKAELASLMTNMSQLKTLLALFDECKILAGLIVPHDQSKQTSVGLSADILNQLVVLQTKSWVENADVSRIAEGLNLGSIGSQNILAVQLKRIMGMVPDHMFVEAGQKQQSLDVIFQFMDLTARKEAGYA